MSFSITRMPVFRLEIDPGFLLSMLLLAQQSCTCKDMAFACVFACVMLDVAHILYFWFTLTNLTKSYVTWAQLQNIHNCCYALHLSWDWTCPSRVQKVTQIFPENTPSELEQTLAQLIPSPKKARYCTDHLVPIFKNHGGTPWHCIVGKLAAGLDILFPKDFGKSWVQSIACKPSKRTYSWNRCGHCWRKRMLVSPVQWWHWRESKWSDCSAHAILWFWGVLPHDLRFKKKLYKSKYEIKS